MIHEVRWTARKIGQRIDLVESLVYRERHPMPPFRYTMMSSSMESPPVAAEVQDDDWPVIAPNSYWGTWMTNYTLRTEFQVPAHWDPDLPVGLYLPLGEAGDFSHPEFLAYVDGVAYAAADRHHQEILLPEQWRDGQVRLLALHGWTGLGGWRNDMPDTKLFMRPCAVVQIDQPTRDFVTTARVALGIAENLEDAEPAKGHLLNALDEAFKLLDIARAHWRSVLRQCAPGARRAAGRNREGRPAEGGGHCRYRARAHRCSVAVDAGPDAAQVRSYLPHGPAPDGAIPRLSFHAEPTPAVRLC